MSSKPKPSRFSLLSPASKKEKVPEQGLLGKLWEEGTTGKRDFLLKDNDITELVSTFHQTFPNGASKEEIQKSLGGLAENAQSNAHALILMFCRYLTRQISNEDDAYVVRLFSGAKNDEQGAVPGNCRIISSVIIPALKTSEELQPVCEAGVPSRMVKLMLRMQTMAVLIESGRSSKSERSGRAPLETDEISKALNVVVRIMRHVCGGVGSDQQQEDSDCTPHVNICAVEDLVRGDAIRSLIGLVARAAKPYSTGISRWIEVHAVDVLLTVVRHGMCRCLADHMRENDLLQPVVEALVTHLDADDTPNFLGVIGLFKVLLQSSVAASASKQYEFVDYVRSASSDNTATLSALSSDSQGAPLVLSLLKQYIIRLSTLVYMQGTFDDEKEHESSHGGGGVEDATKQVPWRNKPQRQPASSGARGGGEGGGVGSSAARRWGQMTPDEIKLGLKGIREFKARRLAHELSGLTEP